LDTAERKTSVGQQTSCSAVRAAIAACLLLCAPFALSGCAADSSYAGIPFAAGAADPTVQALARRAGAGDKHAQLELGIVFEKGQGILRDLDKAERLYALAATDSGGRMWVYSPPVRDGGSGRAIPVDRGPKQPGLAEAARRLTALRNDRGRQ
jgi:hypothetical protein